MDVRPFDRAADLSAVETLIESRSAAAGRDALDENKLQALRGARGGHIGLVATFAGRVVGYAHAAPARSGWQVGIVTAPEVAGAGPYEELVRSALAALPRVGAVEVWSWEPDHDAALRTLGAVPMRALYQMSRSLPAPVRPLPSGFELRAFRPGRDEEAWVKAHNAAFALDEGHGAWDREDLEERSRRPWFDAAGFLVAWAGPDVAGFCWTKVHPGAVGEIYIIGVVPAFRGRGLGTALATAGLAYLTGRRGCRSGMLYVDAANDGALATYRRLGFEVAATGRSYRVSPPPG